MKTKVTTKRAILLIVALSATLFGYAQQAIDVRLSPSEEALIIGQVDPTALVEAQWSEEQAPVSGWRPIFYRGTFDVYVGNSDIAKNLSPKPGSKYLLSPGRNTQVLSIATKEDKADIISVDARYSRMNVETILVGYIKDPSTPHAAEAPAPIEEAAFEDAPSVQPLGPEPEPQPTVEAVRPIANSTPSASSAPATPAAPVETASDPTNPIRTLLGSLQNSSATEKRRFACNYELVDSNGRLLAYISTQNLPKFLVLDEYVGSQVVATGHLYEVEGSNALRFVATSVKKTR